MRLFVAIEIPAAVRRELRRVADELRPPLPDARWVRPEGIHLTLKFLGEVPEEMADRIAGAVGRSAAGFVDFRVHLGEVGGFPSTRRARVIWVGIADPAGGCAGLAETVEESMGPLGFPREKRSFTPHLTLARLRGPADLSALPAVAVEPLAFTVDRLTLVRSRLRREGAHYEALATFPFLRGPRTRGWQ